MFERHAINKSTAVSQVRTLVLSGKYDVFFNLCDGAWDEDRPGKEVVQTLEFFKVPFTGASSEFYEPSKEMMKMVATYSGVKTPRFMFAYSRADAEAAADLLTLPAICKHFNGYSSVGMTRNSRVATREALVAEAVRFIEAYGGVLIEEFIEGREATVLVTEAPATTTNEGRSVAGGGALALAPVECVFPEGETFKHFNLKWCDYDGLQWRPFDPSEAELANRLKEAACKIFTALNGVSFGRCDMRICSRSGDVYFLEINPNCGIFYPPETPGSADCILKLDPMGAGGFVRHLITCALARRRRLDASASPVAVRYDPRSGYGLVAVRNIAAGELVMPWEERAQFLVSKSRADREWDAQKRQWFAQYAWPITERTYVMWSDKPEDWRPINHSCDPNSWFAEHGELDLMARRDIALGESITIDYATFCTDEMMDFPCGCGARSCRRTVRGSDYTSSAIVAPYGSHLSDFVLTYHAKQKAGKK